MRRQPWQGAVIFFTTVALLAGTWLIWAAAGVGAAVFWGMLVILPWWAIQTYDAFLRAQLEPAADQTANGAPAGLLHAFRIVWVRAHDIRYLGALFFLTAFMDLYIIVANPEYSLTVFCAKPAGFWGILAKAQSPTLHILIGYGFMRLRRWSLLLYLVYASFGLLNATANYACFGYGRVRTVFLLTLVAFTAYIVWRRERFHPAAPHVHRF
jgi:hypothetical protein